MGGKRGFEEDDRKARTRVKGDGGKRRSERGRLRTRVTRESEAGGRACGMAAAENEG